MQRGYMLRADGGVDLEITRGGALEVVVVVEFLHGEIGLRPPPFSLLAMSASHYVARTTLLRKKERKK